MTGLVIDPKKQKTTEAETSHLGFVITPTQSTASAKLAFALPNISMAIWLNHYALLIVISFYNLLNACFPNSKIKTKAKTTVATTDAAIQTSETVTVKAQPIDHVTTATAEPLPKAKNKYLTELEQKEAEIKKPLSKTEKKLALKDIHRDVEDDNIIDDFISSATSVIKLKVAQASSWISSYYAFYKAKYQQTAFTELRWELTKKYYTQPQDFSGCELSVTELNRLFKLGVRDFRRVIINDLNAEFSKELYNGCLFYQAQVKTEDGLSDNIFQNEITDLDLFKLEYQARTGTPVENLDAGILSEQALAQRKNNGKNKQEKSDDSASPMSVTEMKQVMLRSAPSLNSHKCIGNLAGVTLSSGQLGYLQSRGVQHFEFIKCTHQNLIGINLDNQYFDSADFSGCDNLKLGNGSYLGATLPEKLANNNDNHIKKLKSRSTVAHTFLDPFTSVKTEKAVHAVIQAEYAQRVQEAIPLFQADQLNSENLVQHCLDIIKAYIKTSSSLARTTSAFFSLHIS